MIAHYVEGILKALEIMFNGGHTGKLLVNIRSRNGQKLKHPFKD
jgi:hypothetical protein